MSVLIFANGDLEPSDWLTPHLDNATVIIAADGGAWHVLGHSKTPDVLIGDLDSLDTEVKERLMGKSTLIAAHEPDKDETDLELALLYATRNYEEEILVFGGLGGRLDQMFANILLLMHPELRERNISFKTRYQRIWLIAREATIEGEEGDTVSLIPLGGDVRVAATKGLRWALRDEVLTFGPARGVSNEMVDDTALVEIHSGHLLCVHTRQVWQR